MFRRLTRTGFRRGLGAVKALGRGKRRKRRSRLQAAPRGLWLRGRLASVAARSALRRGNRAAAFSGSYGPPPRPLACRGALEVRLAETDSEVHAAQRLRYRIFYEEMSATPSGRMAAQRRDVDRFDACADHLLVIDHARIPRDHRGRGVPEHAVVGTYRLLRQEVAATCGGFYTAGEYDIGPWIGAAPPGTRFLELGRSCVDADYRARPTLELMWHGIVCYLLHFDLDIMFGCASLEGTDPDALALPLSYLHHYCHVPVAGLPEVHARSELRVDMNRMPKEAVDPKLGFRALPPLIKGYLRAGATIGEGAVIDRQFGTTDVMIVFPASRVSERYLGRFGRDGLRLGKRVADAAAAPRLGGS